MQKRPGEVVDLRNRPLTWELSMTSHTVVVVRSYNDNRRKRYEQTLIKITTKRASFFINLLQDLGDVSDVTSISRSIPEVDRTDFKVSNFPALYLRLTGSVFVPVKNVLFLMLRTFTRLSILNH